MSYSHYSDESAIKVIVGLAFIVVFGVAFCVKGDAMEERAPKILQDAGYTNITLTGYSFSCAKDDDLCEGFRATGPTGRQVRGAVGCGLFYKGCTVRIDP